VEEVQGLRDVDGNVQPMLVPVHAVALHGGGSQQGWGARLKVEQLGR
jgi:hypothetical protein